MYVSNNVLRDKEITIVSNSKVAVSWMKNDGFGFINLVNVIYDIRSMLKSCDNIYLTFFPRASNSFADMLAKKGSGRSGDFMVWDDC